MTVTSKGQMTLPKDVRDELKIQPGDRIDLVKENGQYVLKPRTRSAGELYGRLKVSDDIAHSVREMDELLGQALLEDDERIRAGR